jgi:hypothetical protein
MNNEVKISPLANKNYGVEINLFRLLAIDKAPTFRGIFSLFNVSQNAEIVIPFYYQSPD